MASIAKFALMASDFPLGRAFEVKPEVTLELDRVVPGGNTVMPYFWVMDDEEELETVLGVFEELWELRSVVLMEDLGDKGLFRAEWKPDYLGIMSAVANTGVTVLSASGSKDRWVFELRAHSPEQLSTFQRHCAEAEIDVDLVRLSRLSDATTEGGYGLTSEQREALVLAYERGYYLSPREVSLAELADEVGITGQSFGSRLRRGTHQLVGETLATPGSN